MNPASWVWSEDHQQLCKVVEPQTLWGNTFHRVWLPAQDTVVRIPAEKLKPLTKAGLYDASKITYIAAAARVADALTQDVLLAPIESSVIPLYTEDWNQQRIMPLFLHDNGRVFLPTARYIWEQLLTSDVESAQQLTGKEATQAFERVWESAVVQGKTIYDELVCKHRQQLDREREKGEYAFAARRRAIKRIGLPQVRDYRLAQLQQEKEAWDEALERKAEVSPEIVLLFVVSVYDCQTLLYGLVKPRFLDRTYPKPCLLLSHNPIEKRQIPLEGMFIRLI